MNMTNAERDAFLREIRIGTLCTLNPDGSPNALPLWYEWGGDKIRMFSCEDSGKVRRLRADPRACLSVEDPVGALEAWVTVEGNVEVLAQGGRELALKLVAIYYEGEPKRREKFLAALRRKEDWVLLELTPTRVCSI